MRRRADRNAWAWGALVALVAAWAPSTEGAAPLPTGPRVRPLAPLSGQTSDEVIARDLDAIADGQRTLEALPGTEKDPWRATSARAWLRAAREEYEDNDRQGFPQAAYLKAMTLIGEIASGAPAPTYENAPPEAHMAGSTEVADSLHATLQRLKHNPGFRCATEELANLEVELAWAGNEKLDQGSCKTSTHLKRAASLAAEAQQKVERCVESPKAATPRPALPVPEAGDVPKIAVPTAKELRIPRSVHFGLGQADTPEESRRVIGGIAALLSKYPSITVRLVGHTDSRGSYAYNLALSKRRVEAVRRVFIDLEIDSTRISYDYRGKSELYAVEDTKRGFALNRRVEMVFVDPKGRDIRTTSQESDLQLEGDRSARPRRKPAGR